MSGGVEPGAVGLADLLVRYGALAAELAETSDPTRARELESELVELDRHIDSAALDNQHAR